MEEERLSFAENSPLQQRFATERSICDSSANQHPGKLLTASHPDTEDALAIVNRRGRPHIFITVTMNTGWREMTDNLEPGQGAHDRPDLCCRVFKPKLHQIMSELEKRGRVFGPYDSHLSVIEFEKRGYPHAHIYLDDLQQRWT